MIKKILNTVKEHSPEVMVGMGLTGMIGSGVMAVKATPKAMQLLDEKREEVCSNNLTVKEKIEATWKCYMPSIILGSVSAGCIIYGTSMNMKKNAALATLYTISDTTLREYKNVTKELVDEEVHRNIEETVQSRVAKKRMEEKPEVVLIENENDYMLYSGDGDTLVFDSLSGRYFKSSMNAIDRAVNKINKKLISERYMSLNDFYMELNIPIIDAGSIIGWSCESDELRVKYFSEIAQNGQPYLVLYYSSLPVPLSKGYVSY